MRAWTLIPLAMLVAACSRMTAALVETRDPEHGFTVLAPQDWRQVRHTDVVWFVPADLVPNVPAIGEFILVVSRPAQAKLDDAGIRGVVFDLLPIHGVSGFQQDPRTTSLVRWYKFEVTGSWEGGPEWASVGAVSTGDAKYHILACAKPLAKWREGQKQCDEVMKTFQPGPLQ